MFSLIFQFEPGKVDIPRTLVIEAKETPPKCQPDLPKTLGSPQFPSIRATARSPPPTPRKCSPTRTRDESKPTKPSRVEYTGSSDSSSSNQSSPESSVSATPRATPHLLRSAERSRDLSRSSFPSMRFHHHSSHLGFNAPGATSTAIVG